MLAGSNRVVALACAGLLGLPLLWAALAAVRAGLNLPAWAALLDEPQLLPALAHTLSTGLCATVLALGLTRWILSRCYPGPGWQRLLRWLAPMLAVPHAAFAIGLAFLIAPSGWVLRALSPWATGFDAPPPWPTTQDPWGLGLIAALVAKEVPFLLWSAASQLQRADVAARWPRELALARTLGYSPTRAWSRVLWPQLRPRLNAPVLAVLAYSLTVVDLALVIGPTTPPTLAALAWQWLQDADPALNDQGAAAAWLLAAVVGLAAAGLWWLGRLRAPAPNGERGSAQRFLPRLQLGWPAGTGLVLSYGAVLSALAVGSVAGVWPFPQLLPQLLTGQAWASVATSTSTLGNTLTLGLAAAAVSLLWAVAWLECAPAAWDAALRRFIYLPLLLPSVLWVVGVHALSLAWGWDARWHGLCLAHTLAATPYVLIALSPAYQGFDPRYAQISASLGKGRVIFLLRIKWPLLKAALASAFAVGFAVSVAQYLPTLFIGAGRFSTVTTEAVTLASGAQRSLTAAYAWLQWLLPALMFALAALVSRPPHFGQTRNNTV